MSIDTCNRFAVAAVGDGRTAVLNPPRAPLSRDEALNLSAWLFVLGTSEDAGVGGCAAREEWLDLVERIEAT